VGVNPRLRLRITPRHATPRPYGPGAYNRALLKLRHHLAAGLGNVGGDSLALRLKAKAGSALAIG
jgi:hypothetical protein